MSRLSAFEKERKIGDIECKTIKMLF